MELLWKITSFVVTRLLLKKCELSLGLQNVLEQCSSPFAFCRLWKMVSDTSFRFGWLPAILLWSLLCWCPEEGVMHQEAFLIDRATQQRDKPTQTGEKADNRWIQSDSKIQGNSERVLIQNMTELPWAHQEPVSEEGGVLRRNLKGDNEIALQMFTVIPS